jgi:predicted DNA-binding protein
MQRRTMNIRISEEPYQRLTDLRDTYGVTMTQVVRACLAVAFNRMDEVKKTLSSVAKVQ